MCFKLVCQSLGFSCSPGGCCKYILQLLLLLPIFSLLVLLHNTYNIHIITETWLLYLLAANLLWALLPVAACVFTLPPWQPAPQFALWVKQKVVSGQPVIMANRMKGGTDIDYDHIM